jgi:acyl carrier protein
VSELPSLPKENTVGKLFRAFRRTKPLPPAKPLNEAELLSWVIQRVSKALEVDPDAIDPDRPLSDFGLDSRAAVTLAGELERLLGRHVDVTLAWDYPTVNAIVSHLISAPATKPS